MSGVDLDESEVFMCLNFDMWGSTESIDNQNSIKIKESKTHAASSSNFKSDSAVSVAKPNYELERHKKSFDFFAPRSRFPRPFRTESRMDKDEMEILKINMSRHEKDVAYVDPKVWKSQCQHIVAKKKKTRKLWKNLSLVICSRIEQSRIKDLMTAIEASESAKTDKKAWKFLKRGSSLKKDFVNIKKFLLNMQDWHSLDFQIKNLFPLHVSCPNCTFYITTKIKRVSTLNAMLFSIIFALLRLCLMPHSFYTYKDTVHMCPLCKIYIGFCPSIGLRGRKRSLQTFDTIEEPHTALTNATSAKNLFVDSKLRLSDRVQVNLNNIGAIARQIQRGSKANESLIAAAKNYALQEAAIENSETNLKKLKVLTSHISSQIESLQSNSSKMESVLEQVRSMQR